MTLATLAQADAEYARNVGIDNPNRAWILSDRDCWYRNPAYTGPAVPHPESDDEISEGEAAALLAECNAADDGQPYVPGEATFAGDIDDDIPF